MVAKAAAGRLHVLMASVAEVVINPSLYARMTYDPLKESGAVTLAGFTPLIRSFHLGTGAVGERAQLGSRSESRAASLRLAGNGSVQHLSGD